MTFDFNQELVRCIPDMERYARRLTRNAAAADDLVQDCLERALRNRDKFEPGTNLGAWLCTILKNLHFTNWNRERRVATVELDEESVTTAPVQEHRIMLREVGEVVATLSADHHDLIRLVALHGDSYQEAAVATGVSIGTIRSRLSRARSQLRAGCDARRFRRNGPPERPSADRTAPGAVRASAPQAVATAARRGVAVTLRAAPAAPQPSSGTPALKPVSRPDAGTRHLDTPLRAARSTAAPPGRDLPPGALSVSANRTRRTRLPPDRSASMPKAFETAAHGAPDMRTMPQAIAHQVNPKPPKMALRRARNGLRRLSRWRNRSPPGLHDGMTRRTLLFACVGLMVLLVAQLHVGV